MFHPLGVVVVLSRLVVWTDKDEITVSSDFEENLKNFKVYREKLLADDPTTTTTTAHRENDNTILLT